MSETIEAPCPFWTRLTEMVESTSHGDNQPLAAVHIMSEDTPRRLYIMAISPSHIELAPPLPIAGEEDEEFSVRQKPGEGRPDPSLVGRVLLRRDEVRGVEIVERRKKPHW